MNIKAGIIGSAGYIGNELVRILSGHPQVELNTLISSSAVGEYLHNIYPHLKGCVEKRYESLDIKKITASCDVVFFASSREKSMEIIPKILDTNHSEKIRLIDLSDAYRVQSEDASEKSVYGLPEWNQTKIKNSSFIANPGCMATACLLGLLPLLETGLLKFPIFVNALTGTSGSGKKARSESQCAEQKNGLRPYKIHHHRHRKEVEYISSKFKKEACVLFNAIATDMVRGILCVSSIRLNKKCDSKEIKKIYRDYYLNKPFVRSYSRTIGSHHQYPNPKLVIGSNFCDVSVEVDEASQSATVISAIDNLVKGAAGQAVQNMNLMFGLEETMGLLQVPLFPA